MSSRRKTGKGLTPWVLLALGLYFGLAGAGTIGGMLIVAGVLILMG